MNSRLKNTSLPLTTLLLILALASSASAQVDLGFYATFPRELLSYYPLDFGGDNWFLNSHGRATKDGQDRVVQVLIEEFDSDSETMEPSERIDLAWSVHAGPDTVTSWSWLLTDWFDRNRTFYSYDGQGRVSVELEQVSPLAFWQDRYRTTYSYSGENLTTKLIEEYNQGVWENSSKFEYGYLATNAAPAVALLSEDVKYYWFNGNWRTENRRTYTYSDGLEIEKLEEDWTGGNWVPTQKWLSAHSGQVLQSRTFQLWDGSAWNDEARWLYQDYDAEGRARTIIEQFWFGGLWQNSGREEYIFDEPTAVDESGLSQLPNRFALNQNYPNPFNPSTTIDFSVPIAGDVTLEVINVLGQRVTTLVDKNMAAGEYTVVWKGTNAVGVNVASGIYFYRITADGFATSKKMLLLR